MEQQYIARLAEAYKRGYEKRYKNKKEVPELKMHYFKLKDDLSRVQVVLGFLHGIVPAGQCQTLLDVGSGRGVFLFPLLRDFPEMEVTSLDILPHRVELLQCLHDGGIPTVKRCLTGLPCLKNLHERKSATSLHFHFPRNTQDGPFCPDAMCGKNKNCMMTVGVKWC